MFDSMFGNPAYLYSWQERSATTNEFTIINDDEASGLKIFYFVLDKEDNLLSAKQIAGRGSEGIYRFDVQTIIKNKDTLMHIGSMTQWYDLEKGQKMLKTKGDSIFSYLVIDEKGKTTGHIFKKIEELNFDND